MIERIVENWLTNTNERGYQIPFCQLLIAKGYRVLYISSHGQLEKGKDVFAIDPDGKACGFQLKNNDLALNEWRKIEGEVSELIKLPFTHPDVPFEATHESFLVTNGRINEVVLDRIDTKNRSNWNESIPRTLKYIDKEALVSDFVKYFKTFLPADPGDLRTFLDLHLADGYDMFPKEKFASFIQKFLTLDSPSLSRTKALALISAASIYTAYCLAPWTNAKNHLAQIEAWSILQQHILAVADKFNLTEKDWSETWKITESAIEGAFHGLLEELRDRPHLLEGDSLADPFVYNARASIILGIIAAYPMWLFLKDGQRNLEVECTVEKVIVGHESHMQIYGESYGPLLMSYYWFNRLIGRDNESIPRLIGLLTALIDLQQEGRMRGLPDPYFSYEESIRMCTGFNPKNAYKYSRQSYLLKPVLEAVVRVGDQEAISHYWKPISECAWSEFVPKENWQRHLWQVEEGELISRVYPETGSWSQLQSEAKSDRTAEIPSNFFKKPQAALLLALIYPHRFNASLSAFLEEKVLQ